MSGGTPSTWTSVPAPDAKRHPTRRLVHGALLEDDYAWLRADNWREVMKDPGALPAPILEHLLAENAYAEAVLDPLQGLRAALVAEMRARIKQDDSTPPAPYGNFAYYVRYREGAEHPLVCRRPRSGVDDETVLLDSEAMAEGKGFFALGSWRPSDDHRLFAYATDEAGSELFTIRVRAADGAERPDHVPGTAGSLVWRRDGLAFYYVALDEAHRPRLVRRHVLGEPSERDALIYEEPDPGWFVDIDQSRCGTHVIVRLRASETSETRLFARDEAEPTPIVIAERTPKLRYNVEAWGDRLIIRTNADGAVDFKIVTAGLAAPGRENWTDFVPHRPGRMLLSHALFSDHLVWTEREDALPRLVVRETGTGAEHAIAFPEQAYSVASQPGFEADTTVLRFVYSSPATPQETWDYDMASRERTLLKRQEIPSGHDPERYLVRRLLAPAPDGALVPVTILHARDLPLDGTAPCLLYGYGAYGFALPAGFSAQRLSLVDRGFVYALAHVRGGTDKGWNWYLDGKLDRKRNSFNDFVACARALIEGSYTGEGRIVAQGGSAGGLLVGAAVNLAPELFAGVIADVPFVDVLNTMLDGELPLTPPEWPEWGDPIRDLTAFETIRSYSPYDRIRAAHYPAILALGGLTDPRVTYWEPAKWIARLRATASGGPFLLRTNMEAGHGGASGRFRRLEETALVTAFALRAVGRA